MTTMMMHMDRTGLRFIRQIILRPSSHPSFIHRQSSSFPYDRRYISRGFTIDLMRSVRAAVYALPVIRTKIIIDDKVRRDQSRS